jgi:hypothetical protein
MRKHRSVSFINAFETIEDAEAHIEKIIDPAIVIHLYNHDPKTNLYSEMFAVCVQSAIDGLQEELNLTKEKANV